MSTAAPEPPPRNKRHIWRWLAAAALLFLVWFCWQLFGPNPPIIVSRETTYITVPLSPDGLPDYRQYVLEKYRAGVTPENNAAVLLWQSLGVDSDDLSPEQLKMIATELGMHDLPDEKEALQPLYGKANRHAVADFINNQQGADRSEAPQVSADDEVVFDVIGAANESAWTTDQLPPMADWIVASRSQLDQLVAASLRSNHYFPPPSILDGTDDGLWIISIEGMSQARNTARVLTMRAMWSIGEGRLAEAWQDILAVFRWARLVGRGGQLIDQLVASAIDGIACESTVSLLNDRNLRPELARQILRDLDDLPNLPKLAQVFDDGERLFSVSMITQSLSTGLGAILEESIFDEPQDNSMEPVLDYFSYDWSLVLRQVNSFFDRLVEINEIPTSPERSKAISELEAELELKNDRYHSLAAWLHGLISRQRRSELIAGRMIVTSTSSFVLAMEAERREQTRLALTRLAAALAVYRAEHGEYPESFEALLPGILLELPVDLYHEQPFVYQRDGEGYLLYSTGPNGRDDGGSNEMRSTLQGRSLQDSDASQPEEKEKQIPAGADDIAIRVPTPPFNLPEPAHEE